MKTPRWSCLIGLVGVLALAGCSTPEAWTYTAYETATGAPLYRGYWHRYYSPSPLDYPYYGGFPARKEREIFKVVFEGDAVVSVESES